MQYSLLAYMASFKRFYCGQSDSEEQRMRRDPLAVHEAGYRFPDHQLILDAAHSLKSSDARCVIISERVAVTENGEIVGGLRDCHDACICAPGVGQRHRGYAWQSRGLRMGVWRRGLAQRLSKSFCDDNARGAMYARR